MRKRWKQPRIHAPAKDRPYYWFRITDSFGKKPVFRFSAYKQATMKLAELHNQYLNILYDTPAERIEIEQAIDFYLRQKKGLEANSLLRYQNYKENIREFLKLRHPEFRYIDQIKLEHIQEYMDYRKAAGKANKTINSETDFLHGVWEVLIKHGKIQEFDLATKRRNSPTELLERLPREPKQKRRVIPPNEATKLLEGAIAQGKRDNVDWYGIFLTYYIAGCRRDEVRKMEPDWVDLENDLFKFPKTKNNKRGKVIHIHPFLKPCIAKALLRAKEAKNSLLFPDSNGYALPKNKIRNTMMKICRDVGISKATPHDLRHSFGSNTKLSQTTKQKIGGWKNKRVLEETYDHPPEDIIKEEYFSWNVDFLPKPNQD